MRIADFMTHSVLAVEEDTPLPRVLQLLIDHGISAVPVTRDGEPIGIISESDLITGGRRASMNRAAWFSLLIDGHGRDDLPPVKGRMARHVMSSPVISISADAELSEAVHLMKFERIKRLPVTRAGKLVGIISRADLLHALASLGSNGLKPGATGQDLFGGIDAQFAQGGAAEPAAAEPAAAVAPTTLSAAEFHHAVERAQQEAVDAVRAARRLAQERHQHEVELAREQHMTETFWRSMLLDARHAAERGDSELQVLRFPREICSDGGRMIDNSEAGWEATLHGQAADIFRRWALDLKPRGFHMKARTLEYPGGFPGDIGLFLTW